MESYLEGVAQDMSYSIDAVITQPTNCPFPLWSTWLIENQSRFRKIYIAMHEKNIPGYDFTPLIQDMLKMVKNIEWIEKVNPMDGSDWRNSAINSCLDKSSSDLVLFTEQDFFIKNTEYFFDFILAGEHVMETFQGFSEKNNRFHPAFFLVPRTLIEQTRKDFSPAEVDHFYRFTQDLWKIGKHVNLNNLSQEWFHMGGLTQNYTLVEQNFIPNYDLVNFLIYNRKAREAVPQLSSWELYDSFVDLTFAAEKLACPLFHYLEEYV